jgi:hypothetical protein
VEYDRSDWLGTLLGPERTSRCGLFFLAVLIADRLTLAGARVCCGFVWVVVVGVVGCGCLLSVA